MPAAASVPLLDPFVGAVAMALRAARARTADAYGTTVDALARRRAYRSRHHRSPELRSLPAGP